MDVINNPEPLGVSADFTKEKSNFYKELFMNMFRDLQSEPDPDPLDLLTNVI